MNNTNTQPGLSVVLFTDQKRSHIIAHIIRLSAFINKQTSRNHAGLIYVNAKGERMLFEIVKAGVQYRPLEAKLKDFKGQYREYAILTQAECKGLYIANTFNSFKGYKYSIREAIGAFQFKNKMLGKIFNRFLQSLRSMRNNKTYCNAIVLYALEKINIKAKNPKIAELLHFAQVRFNGYEGLTPADLEDLIQLVYNTGAN